MVNKIKVTINKNHEFICDINTIGRTGENECTELEMTLDDHLLNSWVYLDFISPDGSKNKTPRLEIVDNIVNYAIPNSLLTKKGALTVQMVVHNEDGIVWQTDVKEFYVKESINAVDEIEKKVDFITEAQRLLDEVENGLTPTIGENGNWFILDKDTGKPSQGENVGISLEEVSNITGELKNLKTTDKSNLVNAINEVVSTGGGTTNYNSLNNKPSINNVELRGNKTLEELGIQPKGKYLTEIPSEYITEEELNSKGYSTFSGNYNDLTNTPNIPVLPTNVGAFNNDVGYLTEHQDISGKADKTYVDEVISNIDSGVSLEEVQTMINTAIGGALEGSY